MKRHVDSAQAYRNEAHVGAAFHESGLKRGDVFLSTLPSISPILSVTISIIATKCISKTHGYEQTLKGVDTSLEKFGVGK